jgi:translation initiation factor 1
VRPDQLKNDCLFSHFRRAETAAYAPYPRYNSGCVTSDKPKNPFAALAGLRDRLPPGTEAARPALEPPRGPARAVVRYQRKGRGGKEATLVEKLDLAPAELETWCRELKRALGCGGGVEDRVIVLAGDQRPRLPALLEQRGVRRVTVS